VLGILLAAKISMMIQMNDPISSNILPNLKPDECIGEPIVERVIRRKKIVCGLMQKELNVGNDVSNGRSGQQHVRRLGLWQISICHAASQEDQNERQITGHNVGPHSEISRRQRHSKTFERTGLPIPERFAIKSV
jgi:hypothetical protein